MTLTCCGKELPNQLDEFLDDKTELHRAFIQFTTHKGFGDSIGFLIDVARERNVRSIYDTYVPRPKPKGVAQSNAFGFSDEEMKLYFGEEYTKKITEAPSKPSSGPKFPFSRNMVFFGRKKKKTKTPPDATVLAAAPTHGKLNEMAFNKTSGIMDKMHALADAHDWSERKWRELYESASVEVEIFVERDNIVPRFCRSAELAAGLYKAVTPELRRASAAVLHALAFSSADGGPRPDDPQFLLALVDTKIGLLLNSYGNPASQARMNSGKAAFEAFKTTWGIEMEFWTFRNYLSRF